MGFHFDALDNYSDVECESVRASDIIHDGASDYPFNVDLIRLLQRPQFAPAGALGGLGRIGVFMAVQPEVKPIHIAVLRNHSLCRPLQQMKPVLHRHHFYSLVLSSQSRKPLPSASVKTFA